MMEVVVLYVPHPIVPSSSLPCYWTAVNHFKKSTFDERSWTVPREQRRVAQARTMTTSCRQQQVQVNQSFPYVPKERFRNCTRTHTHTQLRVRGRGNIHHVAISNRVLSHRAHYYYYIAAAARSSVNLSCTHIRKSIFDNQTHKAFCKVFDWTTQNEWSNGATATLLLLLSLLYHCSPQGCQSRHKVCQPPKKKNKPPLGKERQIYKRRTQSDTVF